MLKIMRIKDVIQEFTGNLGYFNPGAKALSVSVSTIGDKLYSYGTAICQKVCAAKNKNGFIGESLIINLTKYSATTSKHQSLLKKAYRNPNFKAIYYIDNVPRNTCDLVKFCEEYQKDIK